VCSANQTAQSAQPPVRGSRRTEPGVRSITRSAGSRPSGDDFTLPTHSTSAPSFELTHLPAWDKQNIAPPRRGRGDASVERSRRSDVACWSPGRSLSANLRSCRAANYAESRAPACIVYADVGACCFQSRGDSGQDPRTLSSREARSGAPKDTKAFVNLGRVAEILSYRWAVTRGNARELESIYQETASKIHNSKGSSFDDAEDDLKSGLPSSWSMIRAFLIPSSARCFA
jgi:hypothetical protein